MILTRVSMPNTFFQHASTASIITLLVEANQLWHTVIAHNVVIIVNIIFNAYLLGLPSAVVLLLSGHLDHTLESWELRPLEAPTRGHLFRQRKGVTQKKRVSVKTEMEERDCILSLSPVRQGQTKKEKEIEGRRREKWDTGKHKGKKARRRQSRRKWAKHNT